LTLHLRINIKAQPREHTCELTIQRGTIQKEFIRCYF